MDLEARRADIGKAIERRRRSHFGTKSAAYIAAGLNSATWDRIEAGETVRDDSLTAAVRAMWPHTGGDWTLVPELGLSGEPSGPAFGREYGDRESLQGMDGWLRELTARVEYLEDRLEEIAPGHRRHATPNPRLIKPMSTNDPLAEVRELVEKLSDPRAAKALFDQVDALTAKRNRLIGEATTQIRAAREDEDRRS